MLSNCRGPFPVCHPQTAVLPGNHEKMKASNGRQETCLSWNRTEPILGRSCPSETLGPKKARGRDRKTITFSTPVGSETLQAGVGVLSGLAKTATLSNRLVTSRMPHQAWSFVAECHPRFSLPVDRKSHGTKSTEKVAGKTPAGPESKERDCNYRQVDWRNSLDLFRLRCSLIPVKRFLPPS